MKLLIWDLVIGMHAALVKTAAGEGWPFKVLVASDEIDVGGGDDADYRAYQFPDAFLEDFQPYDTEADALRDLQESMVSKKEPFTCTVTDLDEAKAVILAALRVRGGAETNCDGMEVAAFRCVQSLVESLDGDLALVTFTLKLFNDDVPPPATDDAPLFQPVAAAEANHSLSDW